MVKKQKKWGIWLAYLPIAIIILYFFSQNLWTSSVLSINYLFILFLALVVDFFPIRHNHTYYSLISGLSLVSYVIFGLVPQIILTSIAVITLIMRSDIQFDQHYRYPLNLLVVTILSVLSANAYEIVNHWMANIQFIGYPIIPLTVYMIVYILSNQLIVNLVVKYYYGEKEVAFFDKHLKFTFQMSLIVTPLSLGLVYLYGGLGTLGFILGGIPYATIAIGAKYYYKEKNHREILVQVNRYSGKLTSIRDTEKVINTFVYYLYEIFPISRVYYYTPEENEGLKLNRVYYKDGKVKEPKKMIKLDNNSTGSKALRNKQLKTHELGRQWQTNDYFEENYYPENAIFLPLHIFSKEKGVIAMTHQHQAVYDDFFISLVEVFYMYFKIILDNTYHYEKLEASNLTDYLTTLPNFRGFTKHFEMIAEQDDFEELSMVILDLDYFKIVNDVHGHEAGNEVLRQIAELLNGFTDKRTYVARYGGEEFAILLKDYNSEEAYTKAEEIRASIEQEKFKVSNTITSVKGAQLTITASLGVATYPDNCEDIYDLTKLADLTMYTGSKQGGRNKVTVYEGNNR